MPRLTQDQSPTFALHGVTFTAVANSASGAAQLAGWTATFQPQTPGQPHRMTHEELLHVLEGSLEVRIDGESFTASPGDCVLVPAGATLCVSNEGAHLARAWVVTSLGMTATMAADGATVTPPWAQ